MLFYILRAEVILLLLEQLVLNLNHSHYETPISNTVVCPACNGVYNP